MASKPGTRLTLRGEQTRDQILQAARTLFTQRGYHNTSIYDLFDQAETTKGAFFHHWKTKEDLALSILERMESFFDNNFFKIVEHPRRGREHIELALTLLGETSSGDGGYIRLFAIWCIELRDDEDKIGPGVHLLKARWLTFWKYLIRQAQDERDIRADISPENLSFLVVSAICGVQLMKPSAGFEIQNAYEALRRAILT